MGSKGHWSLFSRVYRSRNKYATPLKLLGFVSSLWEEEGRLPRLESARLEVIFE